MSSNDSNNKKKKRGLFGQFLDFLKTFGVIGLAIAIIISQASGSVVNSLVVDIINPFIGLFLPNGNLQSLTFSIPTLSGTGVSIFKYGDLITVLISFFIIAFIVFLAYKELSKFKIVEDKTLIEGRKEEEGEGKG